MKKIISIILVSLFMTGLLFSSAADRQYSAPALVRYETGSVYNSVNRDDTVIFGEDFTNGIPSSWIANDLTNPGSYWYPSLFNAFGEEGHSWRMADETIGMNGGYLDGWYQVLDTPIITLPSSGDLVLSFEQFRAIEEPGVNLEFDGWDGLNVRIRLADQDYEDAVILTDCNPAYNCSSLYSFGAIHHEDEDGVPGIPGWGGSAGWTSTEIDIPASYHGQDVIISFAFASDEYTSTATNPEFTGIFIDEIDVAGVFFNDAEDAAGFNGFTNTPVGGNLWHVYLDENASSPPQALGCFDAETGVYNPGMQNYLTTTIISLPNSGEIFVDLDLQTAFDDSLFPDCDYFSLEVSRLLLYFGQPFWSEWHSLSNPAGAPNLPEVVFTGSSGNWTTFSAGWSGYNDLSVLNGQTVKFRIGLHSNSNFNVAAGLRIDDFRIISSTSAGAPPQNFSALLEQDFSVLLKWSPPVGNVLSYNLYRGENLNELSLLSSAITDTTCTDFYPLAGRHNHYAVSANLDTGETGLSEAAQVFVPDATATLLANDDGSSESGFNAGSLSSMAVYFEPDYSRQEQTVTHLQFYVHSLNSGPVVICGWQDNAGIPGSILSGFPLSIPNAQIISGWNTLTLPVEIRPQFTSGNFFFGINEFSNLPAIGFDEDSAGSSFSSSGGWNIIDNGNVMIRAIIDYDPASSEDPLLFHQSIPLSNFPNPFNPATTISFDLPVSQMVKLQIFNLKGQHIKTLLDGSVPAGETLVEWQGRNETGDAVASGMYLYKLQTDKQKIIKKMLLLK